MFNSEEVGNILLAFSTMSKAVGELKEEITELKEEKRKRIEAANKRHAERVQRPSFLMLYIDACREDVSKLTLSEAGFLLKLLPYVEKQSLYLVAPRGGFIGAKMIMKLAGIKSETTVRSHLKSLEKKGFLVSYKSDEIENNSRRIYRLSNKHFSKDR